jgi:hypothetical protein
MAASITSIITVTARRCHSVGVMLRQQQCYYPNLSRRCDIGDSVVRGQVRQVFLYAKT